MDDCTRDSAHTNLNELFTSSKDDIHQRLRKMCSRLKPHGIHSAIAMTTAGFGYIGDGDIAVCNTCNLEVSGWTGDMKPFDVHKERNPECPFVRSRLSNSRPEVNTEETPAKRQRTEQNPELIQQHYRFVEVRKLKQIRRRTFSHWSPRAKPSAERMITAGFICCNVSDRIICLYCNLICQQWRLDEDDPSEVHKTLSPNCPYVLSMLIHPEPSSTLILNENSADNVNNQTPGANTTAQPRFEQIVYTASSHPAYSDLTKRLESFTTWTNESAPSVENLVRAGFFYTGASNIVTCFYCGGSLQNWGANDNPINEHARWFAQCAYAKQLCGDELHRQIQEAKRARRERDQANQSNETSQNSNPSASNQHQSQRNDSSMIPRYVAARLDLASSQNLLNQNFSLSVIKRSWEDQLQLKQDDFFSDSDLLISCIILQKQIDHIKGNKENIIVPGVQMKLIDERKRSGLPILQALSNDANTETIQIESVLPTSTIKSTITAITKENVRPSETNSTTSLPVSNPCIICMQDEKRLACIPCGHFTSCVPCSYSLRTCPICRRGIEAFVRIYI